MKKIFTLVAVALAAISANAQIETGFINEEVVGWNVDGEGKKTTKTTSIDPDVELASSDNVTMYNAYKCDYKLVSITAEADVANQVTIDGETIDLSANVGLQGQTNPSPNSAGSELTQQGMTVRQGGQTAGAVCKFAVRENGYLFVFHKASYNKNYFAWQGSANESAAILMTIRHIGVPVKTDNGSAYDYTMPANAYNYFVDGETANGAPSCLEEVVVQKKDADGNKLWEAADGGDPVTDETLAKKDGSGKSIPFGDHFTSLKQLYQLLPTDNFKTGNALSIIAIPVRKNLTYYVNACGSKISTNGYAFIPAESAPSVDDLNAIEVSFSKSGETAVAGVAEAKAEVAAPVKVLGANGIQIGNYNVAGQRVK